MLIGIIIGVVGGAVAAEIWPPFAAIASAGAVRIVKWAYKEWAKLGKSA